MNLKGEQERMRQRMTTRPLTAPAGRRPSVNKEKQKFKTYFIQGQMTEKIKIGRAIDPWKRLATLQVGSPDHLVLLAIIDHDCEKRLHKKFRGYHSHGEWYFPKEVLIYLKARYREFIQ